MDKNIIINKLKFNLYTISFMINYLNTITYHINELFNELKLGIDLIKNIYS